MVTVITKFIGKNTAASKALESIFQKLLLDTQTEHGFVSYEILQDSTNDNTYYIIEKWQTEIDVHNHASAVEKKGYVAQAVGLISNEIKNSILINLK